MQAKCEQERQISFLEINIDNRLSKIVRIVKLRQFKRTSDSLNGDLPILKGEQWPHLKIKVITKMCTQMSVCFSGKLLLN